LKVLNLGAGGFIGAHLTDALLAHGHDVIGVDTHDDKLLDLAGHPHFTFVNHDIREPGFPLDRLVGQSDLVIDLVAYANPGIYVLRPLDVFRLNFTENLKIAEACVRVGKRLIQFSSCEVYGKTAASVWSDRLNNPEDPALAVFNEDETNFVLGPVDKHRWIYSCAKQLLERVLHAHGLAGELNFTIIRPFNIIGPKIDYLPSETDGVPRVFSYFMEALLEGTAMQLVDGGRHRRCYMYIDDAVQCCRRIVENQGGVCDRQTFNIGAPDNEVTIRELAELMREIYAEKYARPEERLAEIVEVSGEEFYGQGYDDSDRRIPDIAKARTLLGWEPQTDVRTTLEKTMAYYVDLRAERTG